MSINDKGLVQSSKKAHALFVHFEYVEFIYKVLINCYNLSILKLKGVLL